MNIHITDKDEFEKLKNATLLVIPIGSKMYGTNNENSDTDLLHIYIPSISERNSFLTTHHQLQYKENNIDYIFINVQSFIRNCLVGDSPLNFECLYSNEMKNSEHLNFLYDMRKTFNNYKIIKSMLGMGERDIKQISLKKTDISKNKKLAHARRCLSFAEQILNDEFTPYMDESLLNLMKVILDISNFENRQTIIDLTKTEIDTLRKNITEQFNKKLLPIPVYMKTESQYLLDSALHDLMVSDVWKEKENWYLNMIPIYQVQENNNIINYENNY